MAGDVYARSPHAGRGGWSWYTGSAGWMYRAGLESILGLRRRGETFVIDPCIPSSWPEYRIAWRFLDSRYEITVSNPTRRCRGVATATLDGAPVDAAAIPLLNDGRTHDVQIVLEIRRNGSSRSRDWPWRWEVRSWKIPSALRPPSAPAADDCPPDEDGHETSDDHPTCFTRRGMKPARHADHGQQDRIHRHQRQSRGPLEPGRVEGVRGAK